MDFKVYECDSTSDSIEIQTNSLLFDSNFSEIIDENHCKRERDLMEIFEEFDVKHHCDTCLNHETNKSSENTNYPKSIHKKLKLSDFVLKEDHKKETRSLSKTNKGVNNQNLKRKRSEELEKKVKQIENNIEEKQVFQCLSFGCGVEFDDLDSYQTHMNFHLFVRRQKLKRMDEKHKLIENLKQYFSLDETIKGKIRYLCEWDECEYHTKFEGMIAKHINSQHLNSVRFNCDECNKSFKYHRDLYQHQKNHLCGFGIKGLQNNGICSVSNIKRLYSERDCRGKYMYRCESCEFVTEYESSVKRHVHDKHLCIFTGK